jgi:hypothetical protein
MNARGLHGNCMSYFQKVRLFLRTFVQFLLNESSRSLSQTIENLSAFEKIELTQGLYLRVPKAEIKLMSVGAGGSDVVQAMTLSVDDATQIFRSIEHAYDHQEMVEIKVGELSWKTDCRLQSNPDRVVITFDGPLGRTRTDASRKDIAVAIARFTNRFDAK